MLAKPTRFGVSGLYAGTDAFAPEINERVLEHFLHKLHRGLTPWRNGNVHPHVYGVVFTVDDSSDQLPAYLNANALHAFDSGDRCVPTYQLEDTVRVRGQL